jgi:DNA-directed RNA polymerase subunit RPC12/RpoP
MMETYICDDCGSEFDLATDEMRTIADCIHVDCPGCEKEFMLAQIDRTGNGDLHVVTYDMHDGQMIAENLQRLLAFSRLPFATMDTLLKHCQYNRWNEFKEIAGRFAQVIDECDILANFLKENQIEY